MARQEKWGKKKREPHFLFPAYIEKTGPAAIFQSRHRLLGCKDGALEGNGQFPVPVQVLALSSSCQQRGVTHMAKPVHVGLRTTNRKRNDHLRCDRQQGHQDSVEPRCAKSVPGDCKLSAINLSARSGIRTRDLGHCFPKTWD